jgi:hypothetical protein
MDTIKCTVPGCKKAHSAESMWLPERKARAIANGGRRVTLAEFPKYALCGYHGHLLRQTGVKVYRYSVEAERERAEAARRQSEDLNFRHFAQRFVDKTNGGGGRKRSNGDGRDVGGGLSRCSKMDAEKRSKEQAEEPEATA